MYTDAGFTPSQLGDIDVVVDGSDRIHLFHLILPNHDVVSHLVSDDGLSWERLPDAIYVGAPGECDDDMIWTMHVKKIGMQYIMLYTALSRNEGGKIQRVAKAVSDDLINWSKSPNNPIIEADPKWYESTSDVIGFASWRDPYMFIEDSTVYALISARTNSGTVSRRGCIGWMKAADDSLENWEVLPPLFAPHQWYDMEVPVLFKHDDKYVLICSCNTHGESKAFYWLADRLEGPYRNPGNNQILPGGNYALKVVEWRGRLLLFGWYGGKFDWLDNRDYIGKVLLPPKQIKFDADGRMLLSIFGGWEKYYSESEDLLSLNLPTSIENNPTAQWQIENERLFASCEIGQDIALWRNNYDNFMLKCRVKLPASNSVGIVFRSDANVNCAYKLELDVSSKLLRLGFRDAALQRTPWQILKECVFSFTPNDTIDLQLLVVEENIEVCINNKESISVMSKIRPDGFIGMSIENSKSIFEELTIRTVTPPKCP